MSLGGDAIGVGVGNLGYLVSIGDSTQEVMLAAYDRDDG
jgi:hypothetical protein